MDITMGTGAIDGLAKLWQRAPEITAEEMQRSVTESDLLWQGELMQKLPRGAGGLHGAGLASSIFREEHVLADSVLGLVATNEPYAEYVETGTKPHPVGMKAIQSLADWAQSRLGLGEKEAKDAAEGIAWKIRHHGTPAQPVWQKTYTTKLAEVKAKLAQGVQRIVQRLAGGAA